VDTKKKDAPVFSEDYRQKYPKSCGAACLFYIARQFGLAREPLLAETLKKFPLLLDAYPYYDENSTLRYCYESDIYQLTNDSEGKVSDLRAAGVSLPHAMVRVARLLGLETLVNIVPSVGTELMLRDPALVEIRNSLEKEVGFFNKEFELSLKENEMAIQTLSVG
jgi:hypothetical protein